MKHLFWRVYIYFGVVLIVLLTLTGLIFSSLNRNNIMQVYENQMDTLAENIGVQVENAVAEGSTEEFASYLGAIEDFGEMQSTDIWILTDEEREYAMSSDFANIELADVKLPEGTSDIIESAYKGKKKSYSDFDAIYEKTMLHYATPIMNGAGHVIGVIVLNATVEETENSISQYQRYLMISIGIGFFVSLILVVVFTRQIVRPISQMKQLALRLAAGNYVGKTKVTRTDEIGELAHSLDVLSEQLQKAEIMRNNIEQNRRDFFSNVSHELRTPITVMKGYAETLADGYVQGEEKKQEYYNRILKECSGMERLVADLLVLSKLQNPDFMLDMEIINVIAVAQDVLRSARVLMAEKQMTVSLEYDDECSMILGDYDRIRQLFLILVQNAIKYSYPKSKIEVYIAKEKANIVVQVKDNGVGIAKEHQEDIFEKFYRGTNHNEKDGSGLGLVVGKGIVKRHNGTICVESELGKGSCFIVTLPAHEYD